MSSDRTCKRCSVARVNALVKAYALAHQDPSSSKGPLQQIVQLARREGYRDARGLLYPGLADKELRAICWNVSSFLKDEEVEQALGIKL